jgi:predicted ArsR family transcriptional regulator
MPDPKPKPPGRFAYDGLERVSRHLQLLEESSLIEVWKGTRRNRPQTLVRLTAIGRRRFQEYLSVLESVVADAAQMSRSAPAARKNTNPA